MKKRGQVGSVFKYIFAMIIGAIFILFFIKFASQQTETMQKISGIEFVRNFNDILTEVSVSEDQKFPYEFGKQEEIKFGDGRIQLASKKISVNTDKIVFSPAGMKTDRAVIWTKRWSWPFDIANLFYIWDGKSVSYIVYDDSTSDIAGDILYYNGDTLASMKVVVIDYSNFTKIRNKIPLDARIIWFASKAVPQLKQKTVRVKFYEDDKSVGRLDFGDKEEMYVGIETLIGAAFADSADSYERTFNKAIKRFDAIRSLQAERINYIVLKRQECTQAYDSIKQVLLQELATPEQYSAFRKRIKELNKKTEAGCPPIL